MMKTRSLFNPLCGASLFLILTASSFQTPANATSLSIGADILARSVSMKERDITIPGIQYTDQRIKAYLITDLSKDVEATVRVQSITPWGLETSTNVLATRYPNANGTPWVQNAFVRLPNIWKGRIIVTAGRQPMQWGDGEILSDDDLGFNAVRAQIKSPFQKIPFDTDFFTAKVTEGLRSAGGETDLTGALLGFDRDLVRWELMSLWENSNTAQPYEMGADTTAIVASNIKRQIMGVRFKANLKDAYMKGAYYIQRGSISRQKTSGVPDLTLGGAAYMFGLGGKSNTKYLGRFGALAEIAVGDGDDVNTPEKDEAFRPSYSSRWSGLERQGYGRYFAATFSDAYSPSNSFAPVNSTNDGLPAGTSGIQSVRFGVESTPWAPVTFTFDYYQYKAQKNLSGPKELGTEFDYGFIYRYSGLVTVKGSMNTFNPGEAFPLLTRKTGNATNVEIEVKF